MLGEKKVKDFKFKAPPVVEDKVEQTVLSVEADERPIDYALVIDSSGSMRSLLPNVVQAARLLLKKTFQQNLQRKDYLIRRRRR